MKMDRDAEVYMDQADMREAIIEQAIRSVLRPGPVIEDVFYAQADWPNPLIDVVIARLLREQVIVYVPRPKGCAQGTWLALRKRVVQVAVRRA